jgi:hypothetical protein
MRLDTDTSRRDLAVLSRTTRDSEQRRSELQRLANVLTDPEINIRVTFQDVGAFARPAPDDELHDFEIHIPVARFEQVDTELPEHRWNRRVQMALLFHELGHVFYSDFERFRQRREEVTPVYQEVFRTIYNAAEDVAIEAQLAAEYALQQDFTTLNDTFRKIQRQDQRRYIELFDDDHAGQFSYTLFEAIEIGILEHGFGSANRFADIRDETVPNHRVHDRRHDILAELAPKIRTFVGDMLSIPDGGDRVDRAFEFFTVVRDYLIDLPTIQTVRVQTESFRPVEAGNESIMSPQPASDLQPGTGSTGQQRGTTDDGGGKPADQSTATDAESLLEETDDGDCSPLREVAERLLDMVHSDEIQVEEVTVVDADGGDGDAHRWERARRQAEQLTADLRASLRRRRRARLQSGHRSGQIDPQRLVNAVQGRNRVFQRRGPGDDRDYPCLVVLDRSGSMSGTEIEAAEAATAQLVHALTTVGVDTSVLSLYRSQPRLELPFGGQPRRFADHLTSAAIGGGTPLSDAIAVARERVSTGSGHRPFVIVITDGQPDRPEQYVTELDRCTFDVYGVYIHGEPGTDAQYFDRLVYTESESVDTTVRALARRLFA